MGVGQYTKVKGELQHDLEHELRAQGKESARAWGAWEFMHILSEGQKRFKEANQRVPMQGLIQNQVLVFRPDRNGKLTLIDSSADETTKAIASKLEIFRLPPGKGISPDLANQRVQAEAAWNDGEPPTPNWENLNKNEDNYIMLDDLPDNPSEDEFQLDFETKDLQLTEHQKAMLLPPEIRIKSLLMPASIRARVQSKKVAKRRSRWAEKYTGVFAGKLAKKWNRAVKRWGYAVGFKQLENKAGPTTNLKPTLFPATRRRPKAKGKAQPFLMHESEVQDSPWLQKMVRVVQKSVPEGKGNQ